MLLYHPHMSDVSCADCKTWIIDIKTGKRLQRRGGGDQRRKPSQKTPCDSCPRKTPENERATVLTSANAETLMLFLAVRGGATLSRREADDEIIRKNFAILQLIYDSWIQRSSADELAKTMAISGMFGKGS